MQSKIKIFTFHLLNILKTAQSAMLFVMFALGTILLIINLHNAKTQTNVKNEFCITTKVTVLNQFKTANQKCKKDDNVELKLNLGTLEIVSSDPINNDVVANMITSSTFNKLGQSHIIAFTNLKTINTDKSNIMQQFPIYAFVIFYIMMLSGFILVSSIAIEKINKLRLMTQFKLSTNFLIFTKIMSVVTLLSILVLMSLGTLLYFNQIHFIDLNMIKDLFSIKTNLPLFIFINVTNLIIGYYFLAFIGSWIKTQEELQNKAFLGNLLFMFAFFIASSFSIIPTYIQEVLKYIPILSSYVLDKVTNINVFIIVLIQIITMIIVIYFSQKKYKEI